MYWKAKFQGRTILITGHTGFKGSWLSLWLQKLGAKVIGFSDQENYLSSRLELSKTLENWSGDIRNIDLLRRCFAASKPDIVIHLAAQSLVINGYSAPRMTMETNFMGTVNILECCREFEPKVLLVATSDKVYIPNGTLKNENDALGGACPYSSSKSAAEMAVLGYENLLPKTSVATVRAGNVFGAGDRGQDRLLTDIVVAWDKKETMFIRFPSATRPWQHVLDCLQGYLLLIERLLGEKEAFGQWNFAPEKSSSVQEIVDIVRSISWMDINFDLRSNSIQENQFLKIDSTKAHEILGWKPMYSLKEGLSALFYDEVQLKCVKNCSEVRKVVVDRIDEFSLRYQQNTRE
jgi:CDP-glucose 4,6-dehydratase